MQVNLEDDLWNTLHNLARQSHSTVSELVRQALREKYLDDTARRKQALLSAVGLWRNRTDLPTTKRYVRALRKDDRLRRKIRKCSATRLPTRAPSSVDKALRGFLD